MTASTSLEEIPCIFGHGYNEDVAIEENGFKGRRCKSCGLIYISPRPVPGEIIDLYRHGEAHSPALYHVGPNPTATLTAKHHLAELKKIIPPVGPDGKKRSILEIGCGGGHFLKEAKKAGYEVFGLELNPLQAGHIESKLGIPCDTKPFSLETFGDRKFDVIFHVDVTSHFFDPIGDFKMMYQKLNPNGRIFFETGNGADMDPRYYRYFAVFQYPDHLFFYGQKTIADLLQRVGFTNVAIRSWSILPQLAIIKMIRHRRPVKVNSSGSSNPPSAPPPSNKSKELLRFAVAYCSHFVRYRIGALQSSSAVPRTLLVTARKAGENLPA